jgi:UDP-N-acetylmuramyl pentapeptide synthase
VAVLYERGTADLWRSLLLLPAGSRCICALAVQNAKPMGHSQYAGSFRENRKKSHSTAVLAILFGLLLCAGFAGISVLLPLLVAGLATFEGVGMRQKVVRHRDMTFSLDYYNAGAESMKASLTVAKRLAQNEGGRTVAVLGSILELGEHSEALHREVGDHAASLPVDLLFTFGAEAEAMAKEALAKGMPSDSVGVFPDVERPELLTAAVTENLRPRDVILLKASHSIRLGRVADALLEEKN